MSPTALRESLERASSSGVAVVALTVGRSEAGKAMVTAHSGALAGDDASWEALFDAHRGDQDARSRRDGGHLGALLLGQDDSGPRPRAGEGSRLSTTRAPKGPSRSTSPLICRCDSPRYRPARKERLAALLDPGLEPGNPLDLWGTGSETADRFGGSLDRARRGPRDRRGRT